MNKLLSFALFLFLCVPLVACNTTGISQYSYDERAANIELGMAKNEFTALFPEAKARGAKQYKKGSVEVFELLIEYYAFVPTGNKNRNPWTGMEGQPTWFYFYNKKLVQYGQPNDWPAEADMVVQVR